MDISIKRFTITTKYLTKKKISLKCRFTSLFYSNIHRKLARSYSIHVQVPAFDSSSTCCRPRVHRRDNDVSVYRAHYVLANFVNFLFLNSFHDKIQTDRVHRCLRKFAYISHSLASQSQAPNRKVSPILLSFLSVFLKLTQLMTHNSLRPRHIFSHEQTLLPLRKFLWIKNKDFHDEKFSQTTKIILITLIMRNVTLSQLFPAWNANTNIFRTPSTLRHWMLLI